MDRRRIAVVGAGVAGLTAAYVLQRACEVSLYEAEDRLGGHAHTHDMAGGDGRVIRVDTRFIVHNERTYPTLLRLFHELAVATQDSEMSMSVRCEGCGLQYAGARGPAGLFARPRSALRGRYLPLVMSYLLTRGSGKRLLENHMANRLGYTEYMARTNGFFPLPPHRRPHEKAGRR